MLDSGSRGPQGKTVLGTSRAASAAAGWPRLGRWSMFARRGSSGRSALVGAAGVLLNIFVFTVASQGLGAQRLVAAVLALLVAVASNFFWSRRRAFADRDGPVRFQAGRFIALTAAAFLIVLTVLQVLVAALEVQVVIAQVIAIACAAPINFAANDVWTFPASGAGTTTAGGFAANADRSGTREEVRAPWIVLPTYNEAPNLERIVNRVLSVLRPVAPRARILVVDDASPDGTGEIADRLSAQLDAVEVLHRPTKDGIGRAYVAGFKRALASGADAVIEMDADFSHDPADLPRLIGAAAEADLVLGSRYVRDGGAKDWPLGRRILSRAGCTYARVMLGVGVKDFTGGFKCFRSEVLRALDLDGVQAQGYSFQIELTYRAFEKGFRISEIPITFGPRAAGQSKMSAKIAYEACWNVIALRRSRAAAGDEVPPVIALSAGPQPVGGKQ
jgi:dolichol-phosphate mannosyltransferase